ncbi:Hypothetical protein, putative [Bodo saltans]|uniref:Uncharacterized protein n=1 Tax=Bodo saltans TaxID=75058 RepID=A0A0S4JIX3_BODSA|nr:Hypothetical protein, putative [Bodo saltans]|eukprot:CUG90111.1 Hypothetical protein, putative [Bodo saltans]
MLRLRQQLSWKPNIATARCGVEACDRSGFQMRSASSRRAAEGSVRGRGCEDGNATTPGAVEWLAGAISNVVGTDVSVRDLFMSPAIVDAVVRMSTHTTTPEAVESLVNAISNIVVETDVSVRAAFASRR